MFRILQSFSYASWHFFSSQRASFVSIHAWHLLSAKDMLKTGTEHYDWYFFLAFREYISVLSEQQQQQYENFIRFWSTLKSLNSQPISNPEALV